MDHWTPRPDFNRAGRRSAAAQRAPWRLCQRHPWGWTARQPCGRATGSRPLVSGTGLVDYCLKRKKQLKYSEDALGLLKKIVNSWSLSGIWPWFEKKETGKRKLIMGLHAPLLQFWGTRTGRQTPGPRGGEPPCLRVFSACPISVKGCVPLELPPSGLEKRSLSSSSEFFLLSCHLVAFPGHTSVQLFLIPRVVSTTCVLFSRSLLLKSSSHILRKIRKGYLIGHLSNKTDILFRTGHLISAKYCVSKIWANCGTLLHNISVNLYKFMLK